MRAVNLLPEKHRPRKATGGKSGSSYVLIGVLGAVVVGVLVYVLTANSINTAKTDIAEAKSEATRANAQADALGAYGDFAKIKQQREDSVKQLADQRVDWERAVRELAHVLPGGIWIRSAEASASGDTDGTQPASTDPTAPGSPTITLTGCAVNQNQVADMLVRLRQLQGASDVKLDHSTQPEDSSAGSAAGGSGSAGSCGTTDGTPNYEFQAEVTLTPASGGLSGSVPDRLGGGQ